MYSNILLTIITWYPIKFNSAQDIQPLFHAQKLLSLLQRPHFPEGIYSYWTVQEKWLLLRRIIERYRAEDEVVATQRSPE